MLARKLPYWEWKSSCVKSVCAMSAVQVEAKGTSDATEVNL